MQQSDAMMISSLKEYIKLPEDITTLKDIRTEHIYIIACSVFQALKIEYSELKQISKAQRFRSMTKLTQTINQQMDTSFDLNDIMNPTLSFLRKLLLAFISKLGAAQGQRNKAVITQNMEGGELKYQKQVLKRWINNQFVCPELNINKKIKYQPFLLKIELKKDLFKRNIVSELSSVHGNANAIIKVALSKQNQQRKKRQAEEGITRKQQEENQRNVRKIIKNNVEDWQKADVTIKKLKKQFIQKADDSVIQQNSQMSVFQQQVQKIAEQQKKLKGNDTAKTQTKASQIQSVQQDMNPLQRIKRQCENTRISLQNQLQQILSALSEAKQGIEQKQILKQKLHDQIVLYEERANAQRQSRGALKKQVEKQKILLDTLEGDTDITKQVQQLQQQVKYLETQADKQINSLQKQIQNTKKEGEQKIEILKDLKLRLHKIQTDYAKICQQIQDKQQIKGKVKITKSGISRLYYSKKISEMEVRWRQTQRQTKKIYDNVAKIREQIRRTLYLAQIAQTQIQNTSSSSKLKVEVENSNFKDMFHNCQKIFNQTMKFIEQINQTKNEIQQYEMKVHALAGKDYKQNTKKLQIALEQLKKQIKEMNKK